MMASREEMSRIGKSNVSRSKSHERKIAKLLQEFTGVEFRRRRVEGRDSTVIERESTADVIPVKGEIIYSVEAKCGKFPSFDNLLSNPSGNIFVEWWHQATYDAFLLNKLAYRAIYDKDIPPSYETQWDIREVLPLKERKFPMLFFRPGSGFNWVAVAEDSFMVLKQKTEGLNSSKKPEFQYLYYDLSYLGEVTHDVSHSKKNKILKPLKLPSMFMMRWKDFAENIIPSSLFVE
jgi:hypothetical protein